MLKIEREQLAAQLAAVNAMLQSLPPNDYLGRIGFEARRQELENQINALADSVERRAQVALYFGGDPVIGSQGVQATFGTNVMWTFQDLMSKVWGTLATGAPLQQMGPVRDKGASQLHITSVVHGSFGFLLEELDPQGEPMFPTPLSLAADSDHELHRQFRRRKRRLFLRAYRDLESEGFSVDSSVLQLHP